MWRLRRSSVREVLRIGRVAVERWKELPGGLACVASQPLPLNPAYRLAQLPQAIETLFGQGGVSARVTVILESAWLPMMLVETGYAVWRRAEVEALLRHRFALLHDEPLNPVRDWDIRLDHHAGSPQALGYGFSPHLREALADAARRVGHEWESLLPAWVWGWQRALPRRHLSSQIGHWAWEEQDRMLLGSFEKGRLVALNAAALPCGNTESLLREVQTHAVRSGLPTSELSVVATTWQAAEELPVHTEGVVWQGLGALNPGVRLAKVAA